jgi:hypothetical protein
MLAVFHIQGIQGVRFKRLIMDEGASDRSPYPPTEPSFKRIIFCSGKVQHLVQLQDVSCSPSFHKSRKIT